MGAQAADPEADNYDVAAQEDEGPVRRVHVDGFWIMRYEVSAVAFELCVDAGACQASAVSVGGMSTRGRADDRPINAITWDGARALCVYLGGRLPTEAQWEYAARGPDSRVYPWGEAPPCVSYNEPALCGGVGVAAVSDVRNRGPFATMALAGNLWEWTADYYAADTYASGDDHNPRGPDHGARRVQRGGGWTATNPEDLRSAGRGSMDPNAQMSDVGVRCVVP